MKLLSTLYKQKTNNKTIKYNVNKKNTINGAVSYDS